MKRNPFHGFFLFPLNLLINRKVVNLKIVWSLFKINSKQEQPQSLQTHPQMKIKNSFERIFRFFSLTNYYPYDDANSVRIFIRFFLFFFCFFIDNSTLDMNQTNHPRFLFNLFRFEITDTLARMFIHYIDFTVDCTIFLPSPRSYVYNSIQIV